MIHPLIWKRLLPDSLVTSIQARYEIWKSRPHTLEILKVSLSEILKCHQSLHQGIIIITHDGSMVLPYGLPWIILDPIKKYTL